MRIRPLKSALLGAALLHGPDLAVAQDFYHNGNNIKNTLLRTNSLVGMQAAIGLTYTRPLPQGFITPVTLSLRRSDDNTAVVPRVSPGGSPVAPGTSGQIVFTESPQPAAGVANGNITILNPVEIADRLYIDTTRAPVAVHFVFSDGPESGSAQVPQLPVKFGIATPELSNDNEKFDRVSSQMFLDGAQEVTSTVSSQPTVTQFVPPASTRTSTTRTSSPGEGGLPNPDSGIPAESAPNRSALSTGAIAGIAVGASLAVLLLATMIGWFFYWRCRRQKKTGGSALGYGSGHGRLGDVVAEKEANAIVAESPRSPYSEDGHHRDSTLIGGASATSSGAAGLMAAHRHDRDRDHAGEYPPYSDHPSTPAATAPPTISQPVARAGSSMSRSTADRSSAAITASAPPAIGEEGLPPRAETGMSGRYAHLVEEGMTPEEIARLEEEERQLDVAIEQARGVTTK